MNKFVQMESLVAMATRDEYQRYQNEMEKWTKTKNAIGDSGTYNEPQPSLPSKYIKKWINFGIYSIDQWYWNYDQVDDHPILIVLMTHLPTNNPVEMTFKTDKKDWETLLKYLDSKVTLMPLGGLKDYATIQQAIEDGSDKY